MKPSVQYALLTILTLVAIGAAYMARYSVHVAHDERTKLTFAVRHDRWTGAIVSELLFPAYSSSPATNPQ